MAVTGKLDEHDIRRYMDAPTEVERGAVFGELMLKTGVVRSVEMGHEEAAAVLAAYLADRVRPLQARVRMVDALRAVCDDEARALVDERRSQLIAGRAGRKEAA